MSSRHAELSSHFTSSLPQMSTITGIGGAPRNAELSSLSGLRWIDRSQGSAERRTVLTFGLALGRRVSKGKQSRGSGGSWSRNAELSSLLDLLWVVVSTFQRSEGLAGPGREMQNYPHFWTGIGVFASHKHQRSRGLGGPGREMQNCRHCWIDVGFSRLKNATGHRDRGSLGCETQNWCECWTDVGSSRLKGRTGTMISKVQVAKRRTVVTLGLTLGLISVHNHGDWGKRKIVVTFGLTLGLRLKNVNSHGDPGYAHLWIGVGFSRPTSVNGHRGQRGPGRKTVGLMLGLCVSNMSAITGIRGGGWGRRTFGEDRAGQETFAVAPREFSTSPANTFRGQCVYKCSRCGTV